MQRRLTDDERKQVRRSYDALYSLHVYVSGRVELAEKLLAMLTHNTLDGRPYVEPPLTDEDARQRPWVMIRAGENFPWTGPATLVDCLQANKARFLVVWPDKKSWSSCMFARRATPDEIAAAEATAPDA
jgi:hypothetical protein